MKLSKIEQETIILFNEAEAEAEVYTHNAKLKKRLENAAKKHPELYKLKEKNAHGGVSYVFPKKYLAITFRVPMSDEGRANCKSGYERGLQRLKAEKNDE